MNNQPQNENPKRKAASYSCPSIEADTPKDFLAEVSRACPAMRPYLERLLTADHLLDELSRAEESAPRARESLRTAWRKLRRET